MSEINTAFVGILGQLLIVETIVFFVWTRVLIAALKEWPSDYVSTKYLLTSVGLMLNSAGIIIVVATRLWQYVVNEWPFSLLAIGGYVIMSVANMFFIAAASVRVTSRLWATLIISSLVWAGYLIFWWSNPHG